MESRATTDILTTPTMLSLDSSPSSTSSDPPAGFLTLPLEIRLQIYSYLLEAPKFSPYVHFPTSASHPVAGALLRTNRQINWEATPYLYGHNTFVAHPSLLASFPRLRPNLKPVSDASAIARIHRFHLTVYLDCDLPYDTEAVAEAFSGADELTLHLVQSMFCGAGYANLHRFEEVRGVKRLIIEGSTTGLEEYIAWLRSVMMSEPGSESTKFEGEAPVLADRISAQYIH